MRARRLGGSLKSRLGCHLEAVAQEVAQSGVARARAELHREEVLEERERLDGALNAQVAGRVAGLSGAEERADVAEERGEAARERRRRVGAVGGRRALERVAELRPAWNSNLQPDFNVSVCDFFDASSSVVLRELDESNRLVQKSAESTSI